MDFDVGHPPDLPWPALEAIAATLTEVGVGGWYLAREGAALVACLVDPVPSNVPDELTVATLRVLLRPVGSLSASLADEPPAHVELEEDAEDTPEAGRDCDRERGTRGGHPTPATLLRPGARIFFGGAHSASTDAGVATALIRKGARDYLMTCGHGFTGSRSHVYAANRSTRVARLVHNCFDDAERIDAAFAELTPEGAALIAAGDLDAGARFTTPRLAHQQMNAVVRVFPHRIDSRIHEPMIFQPQLLRQSVPFISLRRCTGSTDSGAPLLLVRGDHSWLYGLCTGILGGGSYFTPVAPALHRFLALPGGAL